MRRSETKILPDAPDVSNVSNLDVLVTKLRGDFKKSVQKQPGAGVQRARQRLKAQQAAQTHEDHEPALTRQQRRRADLLKGRQVRSGCKAKAMKAKMTGGSSQIRTALDALQLIE